ncbi:hypothetical protein BDZ89DRAFT_1137298 [Hymenopellis radicata]|nr:hypothetical protein BDZ89DRAFT_1137298 [Hymenopellis radicata]
MAAASFIVGLRHLGLHLGVNDNNTSPNEVEAYGVTGIQGTLLGGVDSVVRTPWYVRYIRQPWRDLPVFRRVLRRNAHVGSKDDNFAKSWGLTEVTRARLAVYPPREVLHCISQSFVQVSNIQVETFTTLSERRRLHRLPRYGALRTRLDLVLLGGRTRLRYLFTSFDRNPGFVDLQEHSLIPIDFKDPNNDSTFT